MKQVTFKVGVVSYVCYVRAHFHKHTFPYAHRAHFQMLTFPNVHISNCSHFQMSTFPNEHISRCAHFKMCTFPNEHISKCSHFQMCTFPNEHFSKCAHFQRRTFPNAHISKGAHFQMSTFQTCTFACFWFTTVKLLDLEPPSTPESRYCTVYAFYTSLQMWCSFYCPLIISRDERT